MKIKRPRKKRVNETEQHLRKFTEKEDRLRARAKAAGMNLDVMPWNQWQTWFGDSVLYLAQLRDAIEDAEAAITKQTKVTA